MDMRLPSFAQLDIEASLESVIYQLLQGYVDDPMAAVKARQDSICTFAKEMLAKKKEVQRKIIQHAGPISKVQHAENAESLNREVNSLDHSRIPPKRGSIAGCIAWLKSPQNSHTKEEVLNQIMVMLDTRCVEDNRFESVSFQAGNLNQGWSEPFYKTAFYIYEGSPFLVTGNKLYTFEGFSYPPITWDEDLLNRHRVLVKLLVDIEHELTETNLGVSPVLGVQGHEKIIDELCLEGINYFTSQQASIVAGFMLERDLKEGKERSPLESALVHARQFVGQTAGESV